jgi:transcriptional regulator of aroF, aroG, tyrA and aromatic amino acid transport
MTFTPNSARVSNRRAVRTRLEPAAVSTDSWTNVMEEDLRLAVQSDAPVLITAANANRRQAAARFIHTAGSNGHGPFVTLSSALHVTNGGVRQTFNEARKGTLYVDDVAALSSEAQAELCRVVEASRVRGASTRERDAAPVRIIAGASRHLATERATGAFSERLFYRLNVIHLDLMTDSG